MSITCFFLLAGGYRYYQGQKQLAATLAHLAAVEMRLATHNRQIADQMATTLRAVNYYTHLNHNRRQDSMVFAASQRILQPTQSLTDTLKALKQAVRLAHGEGVAPLRRPNAAGDIRDDTASRLAKQLVSYSGLAYDTATAETLVATLRSFTSTGRFAKYFPQRPSQQATLAGLTRLEAVVWRAGAASLDYLAQKSGRSVDWFDPIRAFAAAESEMVLPGHLYKARLFLMDNNLHYYLTSISLNGKPLVPSPMASYSGERSLLTFRVPAQPASSSPQRARWRGIIHALAYPEAHPYAADSAWQLEVPYFIINPAAP